MPDSFKQRMRDMTVIIDEAIITSRNGELPGTETLEKDTETLCSEILKLPAESAQELRPQMSVMISRLEELIQEIKHYKQNHENNGNHN